MFATSAPPPRKSVGIVAPVGINMHSVAVEKEARPADIEFKGVPARITTILADMTPYVIAILWLGALRFYNPQMADVGSVSDSVVDILSNLAVLLAIWAVGVLSQWMYPKEDIESLQNEYVVRHAMFTLLNPIAWLVTVHFSAMDTHSYLIMSSVILTTAALAIFTVTHMLENRGWPIRAHLGAVPMLVFAFMLAFGMQLTSSDVMFLRSAPFWVILFVAAHTLGVVLKCDLSADTTTRLQCSTAKQPCKASLLLLCNVVLAIEFHSASDRTSILPAFGLAIATGVGCMLIREHHSTYTPSWWLWLAWVLRAIACSILTTLFISLVDDYSIETFMYRLVVGLAAILSASVLGEYLIGQFYPISFGIAAGVIHSVLQPEDLHDIPRGVAVLAITSMYVLSMVVVSSWKSLFGFLCNK